MLSAASRNDRTSSSSSSSSSNISTSSSINFFYSSPPNMELTLQEFEEYALARLIILRKVEELKTKTMEFDKYNSEIDNIIKNTKVPILEAQDRNHCCIGTNEKLDTSSHFILRLAYLKLRS